MNIYTCVRVYIYIYIHIHSFLSLSLTHTHTHSHTAAPKGGFEYLAGHDIQRSDGAYRFSLRKQQAQQPQDDSATKHANKPLPRAFAPLNRLYLPEYKSKQELAAGLEQALHRMLHGKPAVDAVAQSGGGSSTLHQPLLCQQVEVPPNHMFTIFE